MKEKILTFLERTKKNLSFLIKQVSPTRIRYILKTFSFREKIAFLVLAAIFIGAGLGLLKFLDKSLALEIPSPGGSLKEGIIGTPRFINPLLAISDADRDLTSLIYSGLLRADGKGGLISDLAERYEITDDGTSYTFFLKKNIAWPDKKPITSDDIIFTIQEAKDPVLKSPQRASWEGVNVEKIDDKTIRFTLKRPYAPLLENMTLGILPEHIWGQIPPEQMGLADFNIKPIGSGPYQIDSLTRDSMGIIQAYTLVPNNKFVLEKPYLENLVLKFYASENKLIDGYKNGEIDSLGGISPQSATKIRRQETMLKALLLPRVFAVFFNQNSAQILASKNLRQALDLAVDKEKIVSDLLQNFGSVLNHPIPPGVIGNLDMQEKIKQTSYEEKINQAKALLEKDGWKWNEQDKVFEKGKSKKETLRLEFSISTSNAPDLVETAKLLKEMWEKIGVKINLKFFEIGDLNQDVIRPRKYDALLFGIMTGRDPDPFAFWHSSQRNDPGLNISLYANIAADKLLEEARTISDIEKREEKYRAFQEQVKKDIPAIFLYSPQYIYLIPESVKGFSVDTITIPPERFSRVYKWYSETKRVWGKK